MEVRVTISATYIYTVDMYILSDKSYLALLYWLGHARGLDYPEKSRPCFFPGDVLIRRCLRTIHVLNCSRSTYSWVSKFCNRCFLEWWPQKTGRCPAICTFTLATCVHSQRESPHCLLLLGGLVSHGTVTPKALHVSCLVWDWMTSCIWHCPWGHKITARKYATQRNPVLERDLLMKCRTLLQL